jgi:hypothetical protein
MKRSLILPLLLIILMSACRKELLIQDVDYSQPVESVLKADAQGQIKDLRLGIAFNVSKLHKLEKNAVKMEDAEFRLIRDKAGYYYLTASGYKHVYILKSGKERLILEKKISVSEQRLAEPAFNARTPHIQLVDLKNKESYLINHKGLVKGGQS